MLSLFLGGDTVINVVFDQIKKSDIDALVDNKVTERRTLEYKEQLPVEKLLRSLRDIEMQCPFFVLISFLGVLGYTSRHPFNQFCPPGVERDALVLPEIIVDEMVTAVDVLLRPAFDLICQSAGLAGSPNYNNDGRWVVEGFPRNR